jgi:hypothetical protein
MASKVHNRRLLLRVARHLTRDLVDDRHSPIQSDLANDLFATHISFPFQPSAFRQSCHVTSHAMLQELLKLRQPQYKAPNVLSYVPLPGSAPQSIGFQQNRFPPAALLEAYKGVFQLSSISPP